MLTKLVSQKISVLSFVLSITYYLSHILLTFQAVVWLNELYDVMVNTQLDLGRSQEEIHNLIMEHDKFEKTAKVSRFWIFVHLLSWFK